MDWLGVCSASRICFTSSGTRARHVWIPDSTRERTRLVHTESLLFKDIRSLRSHRNLRRLKRHEAKSRTCNQDSGALLIRIAHAK